MVPLHMIKGMQKYLMCQKVCWRKTYDHHTGNPMCVFFFTSLTAELNILPISMLSPFLVFVHRPQVYTSHLCMQNIGTRIGFYTNCDVTNHACRPCL